VTDYLQNLFPRPLGLVFSFIAILLAVLAGGFLGAAFGLWAAVAWDLAVIALTVFALRQRAMAQSKCRHQ